MININNMNRIDLPRSRVTGHKSWGITPWIVDDAANSEWSEKTDISQKYSMRSNVEARFYCEARYGIRSVQEQLDHKDVSTTMIYTDVLNKQVERVSSPIDGL